MDPFHNKKCFKNDDKVTRFASLINSQDIFGSITKSIKSALSKKLICDVPNFKFDNTTHHISLASMPRKKLKIKKNIEPGEESIAEISRKRHSSEGLDGEYKRTKDTIASNNTEIPLKTKVDILFRSMTSSSRKRKLALSQYSIPFEWKKSRKLSFYCNSKVIPPTVLHKFRNYLHSKQQTHPILNYLNRDSSDSTPEHELLTFSEEDEVKSVGEQSFCDSDEAYIPNEMNEEEVKRRNPNHPLHSTSTNPNVKLLEDISDESQTASPLTLVLCPICNDSFHPTIVEDHATDCATKTFQD